MRASTERKEFCVTAGKPQLFRLSSVLSQVLEDAGELHPDCLGLRGKGEPEGLLCGCAAHSRDGSRTLRTETVQLPEVLGRFRGYWDAHDLIL